MVRITSTCPGLMLRSISSFIAFVCIASEVVDEFDICSDLPGLCSDDVVHLLQSRSITSEQYAPTQSTNADVLSHVSQAWHNNPKDGFQVPIGTCIRSADTSSAEYHPWAFQDPGDSGGPACKHTYEFTAGPWLGAYNPSMVEIPASLKQGAAKFVVTLRYDTNQCEDVLRNAPVPGNWIEKVQDESDHAPTEILILDANYCVLSAGSLTVSGRNTDLHPPAIPPSHTEDVRLFVEGDSLFAHFGTLDDGYFLAPIRMWHAPFRASLNFTQAVKLGGPWDKNYGLFRYQSKLMAMTYVFKNLNSFSLLQGEAKTWHNSANLLPLQDGSDELLGMMHIHRDSASDRASNNSFWFGSKYMRRFFKLSAKPPFVITALGKEFCLQRKDGKCESVQMVMSMIQTSADEILVSYGVNDCEARFATFSTSSVLEDLSSVPDGGHPSVVKQIL